MKFIITQLNIQRATIIGNCYDDSDNARICFFCYDASIGIIESVRRYLKNILVAKYTNSGFTQYDAEKIVSVLKTELPELKDDDVINFDFSDVKFYYNAFFNVAFTSLLKKMSFENNESIMKTEVLLSKCIVP